MKEAQIGLEELFVPELALIDLGFWSSDFGMGRKRLSRSRDREIAGPNDIRFDLWQFDSFIAPVRASSQQRVR